MSDFIQAQGSAFVAHRLRRSSDRIVDQTGALLDMLELDVPPRGASMLLLIVDQQAIGVVEIARKLRLSHPLIVRMAKRFEALGLVTIDVDPDDARRRRLVPTDKAHREATVVRALHVRLNSLFDALFAEIDCPVIAMLDRLDAALDAVSIAERLASPLQPERIIR